MAQRSSVAPDLRLALDELRAKYLFRDPEIVLPRRPRIDFSSNDYLGLSRHPRVIKAAVQAAKKWGTGSGASRLLSGNLQIHIELEKGLARFKKEEAALVFSSGYLANLGVASALLNEKDVVLVDRLNHASLIDAARMSKAKLWVYGHRDLKHLEKLLARAGSFRRRLVMTDAYFSMDGAVAPLDRLYRLCEKNNAILMVDEAHSTGVYGKTGRGLTEHFGLSGSIPVVMGTLSKAFGSVGGFIAGSALLRETLVNFSREYIYTTGASPCASAAALESLRIMERMPSFREKLWRNVRHLRVLLQECGFDLMDSEGPIIPILISNTRRTLFLKENLKKNGFIISAIRPPTVPKGTDRLRISVSAAHSPGQLEALVLALNKAWKKCA